jgi:hypothetical protein
MSVRVEDEEKRGRRRKERTLWLVFTFGSALAVG